MKTCWLEQGKHQHTRNRLSPIATAASQLRRLLAHPRLARLATSGRLGQSLRPVIARQDNKASKQLVGHSTSSSLPGAALLLARSPGLSSLTKIEGTVSKSMTFKILIEV